MDIYETKVKNAIAKVRIPDDQGMISANAQNLVHDLVNALIVNHARYTYILFICRKLSLLAMCMFLERAMEAGSRSVSACRLVNPCSTNPEGDLVNM